MTKTETIPHSCRYCSNMCCGDVNWCNAHSLSVSDSALSKRRQCEEWEGNPMSADTFEVWQPRLIATDCKDQMEIEL